MPPGFPPGGFSYIYFFYYVWWGGEVWLAAERRARWNFGRDFAAGWRPEERGAAGLHGGALAAMVGVGARSFCVIPGNAA